MLHIDPEIAEAVTAAVAQIETRTDAEVVVVIAPRSGNYDDLAYAGAGVISWIFLLAVLFLPIDVHPVAAAIEVPLAWVLGAWLLNGVYGARYLSSAARKRRQVVFSAAAEFQHEAVHGTPRRTGLLVYASVAEGMVELVPDVGLDAVIPRGAWTDAAKKIGCDDREQFLAGLAAVGDVLAEHLPPFDGERIDLPNAPRIRP